MIAGTAFTFQPPEAVTWAGQFVPARVASPSEIQGIRAECEADRAVCLACEDVVIVIELRAVGGVLEMYVWMAVALKHGAFERQSAAVQAIARDLGAARVAFYSRRQGWSRRLGPEWRPRGTSEFTREVEP